MQTDRSSVQQSTIHVSLLVATFWWTGNFYKKPISNQLFIYYMTIGLWVLGFGKVSIFHLFWSDCIIMFINRHSVQLRPLFRFWTIRAFSKQILRIFFKHFIKKHSLNLVWKLIMLHNVFGCALGLIGRIIAFFIYL